MPDERFTWEAQRKTRRTPPFFPPEWVSERYRGGWQPTRPTPMPAETAMALAAKEQVRSREEFAGTEAGIAWEEEWGEEATERKNLTSQIVWYLGSLAAQGITPRVPIDTETASVEELQSYIESLDRADRAGAAWQQAGGQLSEQAQRQEEIRIHQEESAERQQIQTMESRAMAKEFPEWFASYTGQPTPTGGGQTIAQSQARQAAHRAVGEAQAAAGQWRKTAYQARQAGVGVGASQRQLAGAEATYRGAVKGWQQAGGGGTPKPAPQDVFGQWFKPRQEELIKGWKAEQYKEYPQLFPWFEEAGGWGTGKSFQEWIESEPLAMGYLGAKREQEAIPKEIRRPSWQPARR